MNSDLNAAVGLPVTETENKTSSIYFFTNRLIICYIMAIKIIIKIYILVLHFHYLCSNEKEIAAFPIKHRETEKRYVMFE